MKECVDTFRFGVDDLALFLRNAEREAALTALLLNEARFSSLTPDEQELIKGISTAGTGKRRYLYAVAIVGLYGLIERFVDSILEDYVVQLTKFVSHYNDLPEAIRKNHLSASLDLLKAVNDGTYHGESDASSIIANLHSCLSTPQSFQLNGPAFVLHRGNINLEKVRAFLGGLGIAAPLKRLILMPSLVSFFAERDPPRDPRSFSDDDLSLMLSPITDLVDRRNAIAHGVVDDIESVDLLLARIAFLSAFVQAMHELLRHELLPFELCGSGIQELGRPIAIYNGKIVCFESKNCRIALGDWIVAKTEDSLLPYRISEILDLQVNKLSHKELRLTDTTRFCVRISFTARESHKFFILNQQSDLQKSEPHRSAQADLGGPAATA